MNLGKLMVNVITVIIVLIALSAIVITLAPFIGWRADVVLSGSMEPAIATGGMVIIGPVSTGDIRVGDIIAFTDRNTAVCHRVVGIEEGEPIRFITKGDANGTPDPAPVKPENVVGKAVFSIPLIGHFVYFVKTPLGLFLIILLPILILIGMEIKELIYNKKEDDSPREPE